jgi:hypothetical protein
METLRGGIMIDIRTLEKYDLEDQNPLAKMDIPQTTDMWPPRMKQQMKQPLE